MNSILERCCRERWQVGCWVLLAILGSAFAGLRVVKRYNAPGPYDAANQGYCDFHNGIYFPSLAFARGESPYGREYAESYPVSRQVPPFSPLIIALHVPIALLPLLAAEVVYFVIMLMFVVGIAWVVVREQRVLPTRCLWPIVAAIVWVRPGHITLFNGYFTFELVLGVLVALSAAKSRPWVSAIGLGIASGKPTYFLPLALLMAARGDYAALWRGTLLAGIGGLAGMFWLTGFTTEGVERFVDDLRGGQAKHMSEELESPITSWVRIDLAAVLAKVSGEEPSAIMQVGMMIPLLLVPGWVLWRYRRTFTSAGSTDPSGGLIVTSSLIAIYHNSYDSLLLIAPLGGLLGKGWPGKGWPESRGGRRIDLVTVMLMAVPLLNFFSTSTFLRRVSVEPFVYQVLTSSNAVAILVAGVLILWRIAARGRDIAAANDSANGVAA